MVKETSPQQAAAHVESIRSLALEQLRVPGARDPASKLDNLMTGTRDVTLDDKGRIYIPAAFREQLGAGSPLYIFAPPEQQSLWIFSEREWKELTNTAIEQVQRPINRAETIETVTLLLNRSERITPDNSSRIQISVELLSASGLRRGGEAIIVGSGNFLEVRPPTPQR